MPKIGRFGKRVVGLERAAQERATKKKKRHRFGRRVVGDITTDDVAKATAELAKASTSSTEIARKEQARIEQRRKPAAPPADPAAPATPEVAPSAPAAAPPAPPAPAPRTDDSTSSLKLMETSLRANHALLDDYIGAEIVRPDQRKGAWRLFREIEALRDGGPRADVLASIDNQIAALSK